MPSDCSTLMARFELAGLRFETGNGGLTRAVIETPVSRGELYLHGAHVSGFQPAGHQPVLWMSAESLFAARLPIRGGVPICFPWFGAHPSDGTQPGHGTARIAEWNVIASSRLEDGGIGLELQTDIGPCGLNFRVQFGVSLEMALSVELASNSALPFRFEEALHTYLAVGDIRRVTIAGLESTPYIDKVAGGKMQVAAGEPIRFLSETDRVYLDTLSSCVLLDPSLQRAITIRKAGSRSTVIWNPWIEKSARMPDFGDHEWPGMACIETANVGTNSIELQPGQIHTLCARIAVANSD